PVGVISSENWYASSFAVIAPRTSAGVSVRPGSGCQLDEPSPSAVSDQFFGSSYASLTPTPSPPDGPSSSIEPDAFRFSDSFVGAIETCSVFTRSPGTIVSGSARLPSACTETSPPGVSRLTEPETETALP